MSDNDCAWRNMIRCRVMLSHILQPKRSANVWFNISLATCDETLHKLLESISVFRKYSCMNYIALSDELKNVSPAVTRYHIPVDV